jgi:hypothetical protein
VECRARQPGPPGGEDAAIGTRVEDAAGLVGGNPPPCSRGEPGPPGAPVRVRPPAFPWDPTREKRRIEGRARLPARFRRLWGRSARRGPHCSGFQCVDCAKWAIHFATPVVSGECGFERGFGGLPVYRTGEPPRPMGGRTCDRAQPGPRGRGPVPRRTGSRPRRYPHPAPLHRCKTAEPHPHRRTQLKRRSVARACLVAFLQTFAKADSPEGQALMVQREVTE